jgi:hypothetical protein
MDVENDIFATDLVYMICVVYNIDELIDLLFLFIVRPTANTAVAFKFTRASS